MSRKVYANRTCCNCGVRAPQPEMKFVEVYREVGRGEASFNWRTVAGALLGSRVSGRAIERTVFSAGDRVIKRKVTLWSCPSCLPQVKAEFREPFNWFKACVFLAGVIVVLTAMYH